MSSQSLSERLRQKLNLKRYLEELRALTGRSVLVHELGSLAQAAAMRESAQMNQAQPSASYEIGFSERASARFGQFIKNLYCANPSSVYVWTPRTIDCGALLVPSIQAINFAFKFDINDEGIVAFTTEDLVDSLLLDLSTTPEGEQVMTIETKGHNWAPIVY